MPTREENCVLVDYTTCVKSTINLETITEHNCSLAFLSNPEGFPHCSGNVTLAKIKDIKMALSMKEFKSCIDDKPCNVVNFEIANPESAIRASFGNFVNVKIYFKDFIVMDITDSYVYNFISIFSEVGGSLGVLIGLSCMTIVEFLANLDLTLRKK